MVSLFRRPDASQPPFLLRREQPAAIYAIGDIHGCLEKLKSIEAQIIADSVNVEGDKLIVTLGDYVDRGPHSAQVLSWLQNSPEGIERVCLRGNHEAMFLRAMARPKDCSDWVAMGGRETLLSYGIDPQNFLHMTRDSRQQVLDNFVPDEHRTFLNSCSTMLHVGDFLFVHAGIRPGLPLERQREDDLLWIREPFLSSTHKLPVRVVHGHTPAEQPVITPYRICIDTHAYAGGPLTALRILASGKLSFLTS